MAHWIAHSDEHSAEFNEWAQKANKDGYTEVYKYMIMAANGMESVRDSLVKALAELEKKLNN